MSASGLKSDARLSKQLNSWESGFRSKVRKEEMASTQGLALRQLQRWQSFQVERGIRSDSKEDAELLRGVDAILTVMNDVTEREEICEISP